MFRILEEAVSVLKYRFEIFRLKTATRLAWQTDEIHRAGAAADPCCLEHALTGLHNPLAAETRRASAAKINVRFIARLDRKSVV